jgi:hypothetical protein
MKIKLMLSIVLMLGAVNLAAEEPAKENSAVSSQRSPSSDGATLSFLMPENGAVVPPTFTVKFLISGMGIAPAGSNIENTGHHHLLVDVTQLPAMDQPLPKSDQVRHFGGGQTEVELALAEGEHTLQLLFADYSHTPHDPPVISEKITITVSADATDTGTQQ